MDRYLDDISSKKIGLIVADRAIITDSLNDYLSRYYTAIYEYDYFTLREQEHLSFIVYKRIPES